MTRPKITFIKYYSIKRLAKHFKRSWVMKELNISSSTVTKVLSTKNFKEFKKAGKVYGKGVKVLRKRYLFVLGVLVVLLVILNLR